MHASLFRPVTHRCCLRKRKHTRKEHKLLQLGVKQFSSHLDNNNNVSESDSDSVKEEKKTTKLFEFFFGVWENLLLFFCTPRSEKNLCARVVFHVIQKSKIKHVTTYVVVFIAGAAVAAAAMLLLLTTTVLCQKPTRIQHSWQDDVGYNLQKSQPFHSNLQPLLEQTDRPTDDRVTETEPKSTNHSFILISYSFVLLYSTRLFVHCCIFITILT